MPHSLKKSTKKKDKTSPKAPDYEEIGKMLEHVYETAYANKRRVFMMSFLKGLVGGLGGVIGATVVVALLLWALTVVEQVPFLNDVVKTVKNSLSVSEMK